MKHWIVSSHLIGILVLQQRYLIFNSLTSITTFESSFIDGANILRNFSLKFWIFSCLLLRNRNSLSLSSITKHEHLRVIYMEFAILENNSIDEGKKKT